MGIFIWTALLILNGISATVNYKVKNYKVAMFSAFSTGLSLVFLALELIEYYA